MGLKIGVEETVLTLIEKIPEAGEVQDTLTLPYDRRQKSRQRVLLDSGREAALMLAPGTALDDGDRLGSSDGTSVRVVAALEPITTVRTDDALCLARASYHLGNRHVRLQVGTGWVRYQPDHVLDEMVRRLGLAVIHETARFEPERGAYDGQGRHRHAVGDEESHTAHPPTDEHHH